MSPILAANLFSVIFGINLDRHSIPPSPSSFARSLLTHSPSHFADPNLSYLARFVASLQILPRAGPSPPTTGESDRPLCLTGSQCYISTIYITAFATFSAILMSVYAGYRDRLREMNKATPGRRRRDLSSLESREEI